MNIKEFLLSAFLLTVAVVCSVAADEKPKARCSACRTW